MPLAIDPIYQTDRAQVGDLNALGDPNSTTNHQTNNIHPLWAYRNWSRNVWATNTPRVDGPECMKKPLTKGVQRARCTKLPPHTFDRILPALRLASLLLEKSLPWFWSLRYAPYERFGRRRQTELILDKAQWT
jgi:hypothetical protein